MRLLRSFILTALLFTALLIYNANAAQAISVEGWGENFHADLGAGYAGANTVPVQTLLPAGFSEVVTGAGNGYALYPNGTVKSWGGDNYGQLCNGKKGVKLVNATPGNTLLQGIKQIAASGAHFIALGWDGTVWTCGSNGYGQGGEGFSLKGHTEATGGESGNPTPYHVPGIGGIARVFAGGPDNFLLTTSGQLLGFGQNKAGELGEPKGEHLHPTPLPPSCPIQTVSAGGNPTKGVHVLVLCQDGTVEAIGQGRYGTLGDGALEVTNVFHKVVGLTNVNAISAGTDENLALSEGRVFSWGENEVGELGVGPGPEGCVAPGTGSRPCSRVPVQVPSLAHMQGINAGPGFAFAWGEGVAYGWGFNLHGELGLGTFGAPHGTPTLIDARGVMYAYTGERFAGAVIGGEAPAPVLTASVGPGSITAKWRDAGETIKWLIGYRPVTHPLSTWISKRLEPAARSVTISGLKSGQTYEVRVHDTNYGTRIIAATPE